MSTEINLKTCKCGSDAILISTAFGEWTVCCTNHGCRNWNYGPNWYATKEEAAAAWNRRVSE